MPLLADYDCRDHEGGAADPEREGKARDEALWPLFDEKCSACSHRNSIPIFFLEVLLSGLS